MSDFAALNKLTCKQAVAAPWDLISALKNHFSPDEPLEEITQKMFTHPIIERKLKEIVDYIINKPSNCYMNFEQAIMDEAHKSPRDSYRHLDIEDHSDLIHEEDEHLENFITVKQQRRREIFHADLPKILRAAIRNILCESYPPLQEAVKQHVIRWRVTEVEELGESAVPSFDEDSAESDGILLPVHFATSAIVEEVTPEQFRAVLFSEEFLPILTRLPVSERPDPGPQDKPPSP